MKKEKRNERAAIKVYLTKAEHDRLYELSLGSGYSKSSYMRRLLKGAVPPKMPPREFYEFIFELNKIGTNINQIAKVANMSGSVNEQEYRKEAEKLKKVIPEIREIYLREGEVHIGNNEDLGD
ncbi:MAG: plasmid mobilization relaxosome protein MobC [Clostridiales bacterium]|nr:plasmid mobilization relaxosome protein MobC [Clostridiales bacterium]